MERIYGPKNRLKPISFKINKISDHNLFGNIYISKS